MSSPRPADPVVISGVGALHGLGLDWPSLGEALGGGACAIRHLRDHPTLGAHESRARMFSWLPDLPAPKTFPPERLHLLSRLSRLALLCTEEACARAGTLPTLEPSQVGVFLGSGMGNLADLDQVYATYHSPRGKRGLSPLTLPVNMTNSPANLVSQALGAQGPSQMVSTACSSGMSALFEACDALMAGRVKRAFAGGVDLTVVPTLVDAWDKLGVLSPEREDPTIACRPLHRHRNGMVLGEGGVVFLLERLSTCAVRGGRPLAIVEGYHQNCDALDLVSPRAETQIGCIQAALMHAGAGPEQVQAIHLHGTGTPRNDRQELEVLSAVFGPRLEQIPLAAIKAQTGHCLGASGVLSLATALHGWEFGSVTRLPQQVDLDWTTPLVLATAPEALPSGLTLIQCFAMGGTNAVLLIRKPPGADHGTL